MELLLLITEYCKMHKSKTFVELLSSTQLENDNDRMILARSLNVLPKKKPHKETSNNLKILSNSVKLVAL